MRPLGTIVWDHLILVFFFFREFQPMVFTSDDNHLSSDQDSNKFLV